MTDFIEACMARVAVQDGNPQQASAREWLRELDARAAALRRCPNEARPSIDKLTGETVLQSNQRRYPGVFGSRQNVCRVEVVGSREQNYDDLERALGAALFTLVRHMHAPGTVVLVHAPLRKPIRLRLHKDRMHMTVTM